MDESVYDLSLQELIDLWWSQREALLAFKESPRRDCFFKLTHEGNGKANVAKCKLYAGEETGPHRGWLLHHLGLIEYFIEVETLLNEEE